MRRLRRLRPGVATDLRAAVIRQSGARATGHRRYHLILNRWLFLLTTFGALVLPAAAAQADAAWTGASTSSNWSDSTNWSGTTPPTGTLSFPTLGPCGTCYTSNNDLTGISASGLILGNDTGHYVITGTGFTLGAGGISDVAGGSTGDVIRAPIALSASQTWAVGPSGDYNSLTLQRGVTGSSSDAVTMSIQEGDLFVDSDMEAGPVTKTGPGGLHLGGAPGSNQPGSINGSNQQPVTVNGGFLVANPSSKTGPLSMNGGTLLLLGTNQSNTDATTLHVNGDATLGSSTTTRTYIDNNGSTPGTDFSQLSASGNISVGGTLDLRQARLSNNTGPCVALTAGDVATLVSAKGTLSGRFANAPDGASLTMASSCRSPLPKLQINYTDHTVTATVLGDTATKLAPPSPASATTNQPVTLTATVTGTSAPKGTVAFLANGSAIADCAAQPLTVGGSSGTATCNAAFPASASPESLMAAFNPANGSSLGPSISSGQSLTVSPAATAAALRASNSSPPAGTSVTYTATVTPGITGGSQPSGTIAFSDGRSPITGCKAQLLTAGSPSPTATCTLTYPAAGSHSIAATYTGDPNFSGSSSSTTVTVQASTTPPGGRSGGTGPAPGVGSGTRHGRAGVVLSRVAQSHIRWRKPHARRARGARSVPVGTRFTFRVSRAARVTFTFVQTLPGRRLRARCVRPHQTKGHGRPCRRAVTRGRLVRSVGAGVHHLTFHGRVGRTALPAGSYAMVVTAVARSGARSRTITLHFTIVG
jgi:hypothetical protein